MRIKGKLNIVLSTNKAIWTTWAKHGCKSNARMTCFSLARSLSRSPSISFVIFCFSTQFFSVVHEYLCVYRYVLIRSSWSDWIVLWLISLFSAASIREREMNMSSLFIACLNQIALSHMESMDSESNFYARGFCSVQFSIHF